MFLDYIKNRFRVVVIDTEFQFDVAKSYVKTPLCMVLKDLSTGHVYKYWDHESKDFAQHHFDFERTLFVCHYATAEVSYFLARLMGRPPFIFDTWTEYSKLYKNRRHSLSLLGAATAYGSQKLISEEEKDRFRDMCIKQNTWSKEDQDQILDYCLNDVLLGEDVFLGVVKDLEIICGKDYETLLEQAMARGQAMACFAKMQKNGIPVNNKAIAEFNAFWPDVKHDVIQRLNKKVNLYDENSKFSNEKFYDLITKLDLIKEWPRTPKGKLKTNKSTLEEYQDAFSEIYDFKQVKGLLDSAKLAAYQISEDGRYRPDNGFKPFGTHTGRCSPSSKWIFGTSKWGRNFMQPSFGNVLVYLDYKSEEPYVAALLSGDKALEASYLTKDIYLATAKLAEIIPQDALREDHEDIREAFKVIVLATNYGMGMSSISKSLKRFGFNASEAAGLMRKYKELYHVYFEWLEVRTNHAQMHGYISTSMGWDRHFAENSFINPRSLMNWSIQSESAEILRNALIRLTDAHIKVCATVHDAFLIECPIPESEDQIRVAIKCMTDAARYIVGGENNILVDTEKYFYTFNKQGQDKNGIYKTIFEEIDKYKKQKTWSGTVAKHGHEGIC